jgi:hypothetical protein
MCQLFKITHNLVDIPEAAQIVKASDRRTRGANRLFVPYTNITVYKQSFFPRTIQDWNRLPTKTTDISDIEAFKAALHVSVAAPPQSSAYILIIQLLGNMNVLPQPSSVDTVQSRYGFLSCIRKKKKKKKKKKMSEVCVVSWL